MILDRSTIERFCSCPHQGLMLMIRGILIAKLKGLKVEQWEDDLCTNHPDMVAKLQATLYNSDTSEICEVGIEVHKVIENAFIACKDTDDIPEWLLENLPACRPDIQPKVIKAARYICEMLVNLHVTVLGSELQFDYVLLPATKTREQVTVTSRQDLVCQGLNNSIHVFDWKSGYKKRTNSEAFDSFQAQFNSWILFSQPEYAQVETIHWWYYETRFGTRAYARFNRNEEHPRLPHLTTFVAIDARIRSAVKLLLDQDDSCWPTEQKCSWCGVIESCKLAHIEAAAIAEDPKAYIDQLIVDEQSVKNRKKAATMWIKAKGPIRGTAVVYDRKKPADRFTAEFREIATESLIDTGNKELDSHFK